MIGVLGGDAFSYQVVKNESLDVTEKLAYMQMVLVALILCTEENFNLVCDLIEEDRQLATRRLAEKVGLSIAIMATLMNYHVGQHNMSARWVSRMLTPEQKREKVITSEANLAPFNSNPKNISGSLCYI